MIDARKTPFRFPDFFIIGAPKSGTTALSTYLMQHPDIGFSVPKEPHYFNDDFSTRYTYSLGEYMKCFGPTSADKPSVGEGSVFYLRSRTAVPNILKYAPDAKFIVMLRNPVEAVYSWHWQAIYSFGENILDFEQAWLAQRERAQGRRIPRYNRLHEALEYGPLFTYGEQLERLYRAVPEHRVRVILFDDLQKDPSSTYKQTLEFLNVRELELPRYDVINSSKKNRYQTFETISNGLGAVKRALGIKRGFGALKRLKKWNTRYQQRPPLSASFKSTLRAYYHDDVLKTSSIIHRNLDEWVRD